MALVYKDRVRETSTTTGTGTLTLAGAVTGFQTFGAIGDGNTCCYVIEAVDGNNVPTGQWECGIGTYTASGTTLARTTVLSSSNSGSAVNLSAGTKHVYVSLLGNVENGSEVALSDGATVALNAALGFKFRLSAAGSRTILAPTNAVAGKRIVIEHLASGAARTLSLTTGSSGAFRFGSDITALSETASGKTDYIGAIYNATDARWDVVAVAKGY